MKFELNAVFATSGTDALSLLFGNKVDIAFMGITPFVIAKSYGLPVYLLSVSQPLAYSHQIVLRKPVDEGQPRCPLQIATTIGSTSHELAGNWALSRSISVKFIHLQPREQPAAFSLGYVDGLAAWQPYVALSEMDGGKSVFAAADLASPTYNAIVVTGNALRHKRHSVEQFLNVHAAAVAQIRASSLDDFLGTLPNIFSAQIPPPRYKDILQDNTVWPDELCEKSESKDSVCKAILQSQAFLLQERLSGAGHFEIADCFAETIERHAEEQRTESLSIGYSDSMMCAPFHFARFEGIFAAQGFSFISDPLRPEHRVLGLSSEVRRQALDIAGLKDSNRPDLALIEMRRTVEALLRETYFEFFGKTAPKSLDTLIEAIYHAKDSGMPTEIYSATHWIRVITNPVVHDTGQRNSAGLMLQYDSALPQLLRILEWASGERRRWLAEKMACNCGEVVNRVWSHCPECRKYLGSHCFSCREPIEPRWNSCANCGIDLGGTRQGGGIRKEDR